MALLVALLIAGCGTAAKTGPVPTIKWSRTSGLFPSEQFGINGAIRFFDVAGRYLESHPSATIDDASTDSDALYVSTLLEEAASERTGAVYVKLRAAARAWRALGDAENRADVSEGEARVVAADRPLSTI